MELSKTDTASIKGIAILLMLWHHLFLDAPEFGTITHSLAIVSKVCVALFLFVSGYGLTRQYRGQERRTLESTVKLLGRRFINFFFQYWFCFFIVVLIGNICGYSFHDAYPATRNTFKCFILDFWGQMGYNSYLQPWWFNKMIIQLYLVFPIFYLIVSNKYSALAGLITIAFLYLFAKSLPGNVFFFVEGGIPAFYLGMCSAYYRITLVFQKKVWRIVMMILSCLMVFALSLLLLKAVKDPNQAVLIRAVMALCIVYAYKTISCNSSKVIAYLGNFAAIMYLSHVLFLKIIPQIVYYSQYSVLVFFLFTVICLGTARFIAYLEQVTHYDKLRISLLNQLGLS